jgi:transposase
MSDVEECVGTPGGHRRRRLWPLARKQQIIAESLEPGASVADVARRHGVNANLLFTWRRQIAVAGTVAMREPMGIVPVTVTAETAPRVPVAASGPVGRMEIVLGAGERIIVGADVDGAALTRIIRALSRQ